MPVWFWWSVIFFAVFLIGVTKSGFGAGVGLMIVPMTVVAIGHTRYESPVAALGLMLPLLVAGDFLAVGQYRKLFDRRILLRLLPGSLAGIAVGGWLLWRLHAEPLTLIKPLIKLEVAIESIILVGLHWWRVWRGDKAVFRPSLFRSSAVGAAAGISSTLAHAAGPIIALHLLPQKLERRIFVGTCAIYFCIVNVLKLPAYNFSGMFSREILLLGARLSPLVLAGAVLGFWVTRRMNDALFSKIVYIATFALGWYLLIDSTMELWTAGRP